MKSSLKYGKDSGLTGTLDARGSVGGSGGITYSTIANIPKAKRNKLIAEAKPMVSDTKALIVVLTCCNS